MPQKVQGPDGKIYQFPDGTTREQAVAYFKKRSAPVMPARPEASYAGEIISGVGRGAKTSLIDAPMYMGKTLLDSATKYGMFAPTMAVTKMLNDLLEGLGQGAEARRTVKKQGEGLAGQTLATLENYPVIGPMVRKAEEGGTKMFSPQSLGATAEAITTFKAPEVAGKVGAKTVRGARIAGQELAGAGREPVLLEKVARGKSVKSAESVQRLTEMKERYDQLATKNIIRAERGERFVLDKRWDAWRKKLKGQMGEGEPIRKAVEDAEAKYIKGSPENIKIFRELTSRVNSPGDVVAKTLGYKTEAEAITAHGPQVWEQMMQKSSQDPLIKEASQIPADDLQGFYTELGDKMYGGGNIPGDVFQAMRHVRESVGKELGSVSERVGAGKEYRKLKSDWADYENTWHESASPLSKVVKLSRSPQTTKMGIPMWRETGTYLKGNKGARAIDLLKRKTKYGANPEIISRSRAINAKIENLPKGKVPPEIDPVEVRRQILLKRASKPFWWLDLFPPYLVQHLAIKNPAIREWLAKQPRRELTR